MLRSSLRLRPVEEAGLMGSGFVGSVHSLSARVYDSGSGISIRDKKLSTNKRLCGSSWQQGSNLPHLSNNRHGKLINDLTGLQLDKIASTNHSNESLGSFPLLNGSI